MSKPLTLQDTIDLMEFARLAEYDTTGKSRSTIRSWVSRKYRAKGITPYPGPHRNSYRFLRSEVVKAFAPKAIAA